MYTPTMILSLTFSLIQRDRLVDRITKAERVTYHSFRDLYCLRYPWTSIKAISLHPRSDAQLIGYTKAKVTAPTSLSLSLSVFTIMADVDSGVKR